MPSENSRFEETVLILAPLGKDAAVAQAVLKEAGFEGAVCRDMASLCSQFKNGAGAIVMTEEALSPAAITLLKETLDQQEPWSDIPIIVLTSRSNERKSAELLKVFGMKGNINLLERTFRPVTLISLVQVALRARRRQYQVRDLIQDIHESSENLKRSNQELEQFAYIASHDLQEPLRMVTAYTQLLSQRYKEKLDDDAKEFIHFATDGAKRSQELISDLLEYSRTRQNLTQIAEIDCEALLKDVKTNLKITIEEKNAQVTNGPLPVIKADRMRLMQVFQNLIGNALKFCKNGNPRVEIQAEEKPEAWQFSVRDNGIGIQPEYLNRIFVIFQRLHNRSEYPGTGIGLAICKKIVEHHGGRLWVESEPGKGSTFYFSISKHLGNNL